MRHEPKTLLTLGLIHTFGREWRYSHCADQLRQVFNDTAEVHWLIIGAPEELELLRTTKTKPDMSLIYQTDPTQLPRELTGVEWPPKI